MEHRKTSNAQPIQSISTCRWPIYAATLYFAATLRHARTTSEITLFFHFSRTPSTSTRSRSYTKQRAIHSSYITVVASIFAVYLRALQSSLEDQVA